MLAVSLGLHAAAALALAGLQRGPMPEAREQQVALVWSEQAPGAGDAADLAMLSAAAAPPEQQAPPTRPVLAPEPPARPSGATAEDAPPSAFPQAAEEAPPLPPPPAPPAPQRPVQVASAPRTAASAPETAAATAASIPMASGAGQALGAVIPVRQRPGAANATPAYPYASRIRSEQGRVTLLVEVDAQGDVADVRVLSSSGFPALDRSAVEAVRQWRFEAALREGVPIFSTTSIGIAFQLEGDRRW